MFIWTELIYNSYLSVLVRADSQNLSCPFGSVRFDQKCSCGTGQWACRVGKQTSCIFRISLGLVSEIFKFGTYLGFFPDLSRPPSLSFRTFPDLPAPPSGPFQTFPDLPVPPSGPLRTSTFAGGSAPLATGRRRPLKKRPNV